MASVWKALAPVDSTNETEGPMKQASSYTPTDRIYCAGRHAEAARYRYRIGSRDC
jgi:hypothetical protein